MTALADEDWAVICTQSLRRLLSVIGFPCNSQYCGLAGLNKVGTVQHQGSEWSALVVNIPKMAQFLERWDLSTCANVLRSRCFWQLQQAPNQATLLWVTSNTNRSVTRPCYLTNKNSIFKNKNKLTVNTIKTEFQCQNIYGSLVL